MPRSNFPRLVRLRLVASAICRPVCLKPALSIALLTVAVILVGHAPASAVTTTTSAAPPRPKFYVNEKCTTAVASQFKKYGAQRAIIINGGSFIDPDDDGIFDPAALAVGIQTYVSPNFSGPVCLDWEGVGMQYLTNPPTPYLFSRTRAEYIKAAQFFKAMRPNAKVGFYGLPRTMFHESGTAWINAAEALRPLFDQVDCLFPSVYSMYALGDPSYTMAQDGAYVRRAIWISLKVAGNKPVYAYVWPRFFDGHPTKAMKLIPGVEFMTHVKEVFTMKVAGRRAAGIVWWGADKYFLQQSKQNLAPEHPEYEVVQFMQNLFQQEWLGHETDSQHLTRIHLKTLKQLYSVIRHAPTN